jgi:hypothetical protein
MRAALLAISKMNTVCLKQEVAEKQSIIMRCLWYSSAYYWLSYYLTVKKLQIRWSFQSSNFSQKTAV